MSFATDCSGCQAFLNRVCAAERRALTGRPRFFSGVGAFGLVSDSKVYIRVTRLRKSVTGFVNGLQEGCEKNEPRRMEGLVQRVHQRVEGRIQKSNERVEGEVQGLEGSSEVQHI